jgi:hypothetical protein
MNEDDRDFDPMIYDAMRELATRIGGRYVFWADQASDPVVERYWLEESYRVDRGVRAVDTRSKSAIEAKRRELREHFAQMPENAPEVTAR